MKAVEWKRLIHPMLDEQWSVVRALAYRVPVGWVLYGLLAESSAWGRGAYLWRVRMPLYVPVGHVVLDWSDRVGGGSRFYETAEELAEAVRRVLPEVVVESQSRSAVVDAPGLDRKMEPETMQETRAYGLVLEGDVKQAIRLLSRVASIAPQFDWVRELVDRAAESRDMLQQGRTDDLRQRLEAWRQQTMAALQISPD